MIAEWLGWSDFETLMNARSDGLWCKDEDEYNDWLEENEANEDEEDEEEDEE